MFSDTNTGTKILPLYTAMVWPTKSGVIVERRLQVLTAVFLPPLSAPSTLFIRCVSTKAPFLSERAILFLLHVLRTTTHDKPVGPLVVTRLLALGLLAPRRNRMAAARGTSLTATHGVIDGVHGHTTNLGTLAEPA